MAYIRKNLTPEQRSEQARKAAMARKSNGGGRPRGSFLGPNGESKMAIPRRTVQVFEMDHAVFRKMAFHRQCSMVDFFHIMAETLRKQYPHIAGRPTAQ